MNIRALNNHQFGPIKADEYDWWNRPYRVFEPGQGMTPLDVKQIKQTHPVIPPIRDKNPDIREKSTKKIHYFKSELRPLMGEFWRTFLHEKRELDILNRRLMRVNRFKREKEIAIGRIDKTQDRIIAMLFQRYAVKNKKIIRMFSAINQQRSKEYKSWVVDMIHSSINRSDFKVALQHQLKDNPFNTAFSSPNEKKRPKLYREEAIKSSINEHKFIRKEQRIHTNYIYNILIKSSHILPELYKEFKDVFDEAFRELVVNRSNEEFDLYTDKLDRCFTSLFDSVLQDEKILKGAGPALINSFIDEALDLNSEINTALEINHEQEQSSSSAKPSAAVLSDIREANFEAFMAQATIPNITLDEAPNETLRKNIQSTMALYPDQVNESKRMIQLYAKLSSDSKPALEAEFMAGVRDVEKASRHHNKELEELKRTNDLENAAYQNMQTYNLEREITAKKEIDPGPDKEINKEIDKKYAKGNVKKVSKK